MKNEGDFSVAEIVSSPVFSNDLFLDLIFSFTDFTTLKNCRAVCSKWNSVIEPGFRKRTKIACRPKSYDDKNEFPLFKTLFCPNGSDFQYTSLLVVGRIKWKTSEFRRFMFREGRFITELEIYDLTLFNRRGKDCEIIDLSKFVTPTLRRLIVNNSQPVFQDMFFGPPVTLKTRCLSSIDYLSLCNCQIIRSKGVKISPTEMMLQRRFNYFRIEETRLRNLRLNQFVNFERLKKLSIEDDYQSLDLSGSNSLDLSGSNSLEYLKFCSRNNVVNWDTSQWSIKKLEMEGTSFTIRTTMNVTELIIKEGQVDLSVLPTTVEKLILQDFIFATDRPTVPINVPNLKCLVIMTNKCSDFPSYFANCDTIAELGICNHPLAELPVDNLPKNLQKLFLNPQYLIMGNRETKLDLLVLADRNPNDMDGRELSRLPAKHLVYLNCSWKSVNFNDHCIGKIVQISKTKCETVTVGPFTWDEVCKDKFSESIFSNCNGRGVENEYFYIFQAGFGKVIDGHLVRRKIDSIAKYCTKYCARYSFCNLHQ